MNPRRQTDSASTRVGSDFRTTHWSVVLAAGNSTSPLALAALEKLCRSYWYPLYAFIRRRGHSEHDAQDLTQGFFAQLLRREALREVMPGPAKFRSFLLASLKNYLADEHGRATALKRGGGQEIVSFDAQQAEDLYRLEPVDDMSPDTVFDRRWAATLLNVASTRLEQEFAHDRAALFNAVRSHLGERNHGKTYAEIAAELGMTEEAVKKSVQRLRRRFQTIIREEIARTVASAREIEEELRYLWSIVAT
jgi:RNA polymerase sigma factor (sigma-70 family)